MNKLKTLTVNNGTNNKPIGTIAIVNLPKSWRKTLEEGGKVYLSTYPNHTEAHFKRLHAWSPSWKSHRSTEMPEFISSDSLANGDEPDESDIPIYIHNHLLRERELEKDIG